MLGFTRQRKEFAYSLLLIILIPASIIGSTLWLTSQVKSNFDQELRRKANLANEVFGVSVANALAANPTKQAGGVLDQLITQTLPHAPEIDRLIVSVPQGGDFQIISSSESGRVGQSDENIQTKLAAAHAQPVASLVARGEAGTREWMVATPVIDNSGRLIAVTTMNVSLAAADALMSETLRTSNIILAVILAVTILLLLNHFRLVQYAELFRKQKELDQMKDDFISIATHELKAPMSVIKGYISMALEEKPAKMVTEMLTTAFEQTNRLGRLVNDLLDVSRIEQGKTKYHLSAVDLGGVIKPLITVYQVKAQEKNLKLNYQPPEGLPAASGDVDRVAEIFTNLIDNAIKYSKTGTVTVSHQVTEKTIATTISDTGIGMTPDEQTKLFQRFYRVRNADTAEISGTGLGLWIIRQYAERMGGSISAESQKGQGARFTVTLPRA